MLKVNGSQDGGAPSGGGSFGSVSLSSLQPSYAPPQQAFFNDFASMNQMPMDLQFGDFGGFGGGGMECMASNSNVATFTSTKNRMPQP